VAWLTSVATWETRLYDDTSVWEPTACRRYADDDLSENVEIFISLSNGTEDAALSSLPDARTSCV